ncbi:MAG TPA: MobF family relaxase [Chitinophagaceae bacterium]|nr:MobF family relaxase [Chitinophagaceae bacterium]
MIRMVQSNSARHAKTYFSDALVKSDYFMDDQELAGRFEGKLAERMGINGKALKEAFFALCDNRHPVTKDQLTPNTKANRIIGYDINFHCPKSVSLLHVLSKDNHILTAFEASVFETMKDIEADSKTRVRKGGRYDDRTTGELAWAEFVHQTARPVDGSLPDPHLHCHAFVLNMTWDEIEKKIKAGKFRDIKRDMPYYQSRFHKRLSDRLIDLGYRIKRTESSFEIEGVPQQVIDLFSKRTDQIGRVAKEKGIHEARELDALGAKTRAKKQKGHSMEELKQEWRRQILALGESVNGGDEPLRYAPKMEIEKTDPKRLVDHALKHCFERASVMPERRILEKAYHHALGVNGVSLNDLTREFRQDERIIHVKHGDRKLCTTKAVLAEEKRMVDLARQGMNKFRPLYLTPPIITLKDQQHRAAYHVLTTTHKVSIIRGAAGTGKTRMMKETVKLIEDVGKNVIVVAPTAQASRGVLKDEGFKDATTVANFLVDKKMHEQLQDQVLWVDEAGLLGTKDMKDILEIVTKQNARLILSGDTKQHASVVRGDALRILNTVAGIKSAEMNKIQRQKDARYRSAVEDLSKGSVANAFEKLDALESIMTVDPLNPNEELVKDYLAAVKNKKDALIISPTHKQGEEVTHEIREGLRAIGLIGKHEINVPKLTSLNYTEAEKTDVRNYKKGQVVRFNNNLRGIKRGSAWTVRDVTEDRVEVMDFWGQTIGLPLAEASKFDVFEKSEMGLSKGDKIQITRNGFDKNKKRLNNGQTFIVKSVNKSGKILVKSQNGKTSYVIDQDYGHLAHAHCITSYAAQGKTVDEVFISQPAATFAATDARQFYVSVSRAREAVKIYTDDKTALLDYAAELGERQSALELVSRKKSQRDHVGYIQHAKHNHPAPPKQQQLERMPTMAKIDRDYEPRL